jgi:hypothetical protein
MFRFACECGCLSRKEYFAAAQVDFNFVSISRAVSFPLSATPKFTLSWRFRTIRDFARCDGRPTLRALDCGRFLKKAT